MVKKNMIIKSNKKPTEFEHKYWLGLNMASALSSYLINNDAEILIEPCDMLMSIFIYCDSLSKKELITIYNDCGYFESIGDIPKIDQTYFDEADFTFEKPSKLFGMMEQKRVDNVVEISNWR